jgi:Outer membrane protein beta-barrel domain
MKKLILALLAAGTMTTANAQEPRSILLYGDVGFHSDRLNDLEKNTHWNVNTGVGYQFNHNWTIGLHLMWAQNADKAGIDGVISNPFVLANIIGRNQHLAAATQGESFTENIYAVGPFARYSHYIRRSETFFWFTQLDFDYAGGYWTNQGNPAFLKHSGVFANLFPGLGINVGCGYALNFTVGGLAYTSDKLTDATYSRNAFDFTFGQQLNFGLSKNFNVGHKMHSHCEPGDEVHRRKMDKIEDEDDAAPKSKRKEKNRDEDE